MKKHMKNRHGNTVLTVVIIGLGILLMNLLVVTLIVENANRCPKPKPVSTPTKTAKPLPTISVGCDPAKASCVQL